jgi:hypothetical protein
VCHVRAARPQTKRDLVVLHRCPGKRESARHHGDVLIPQWYDATLNTYTSALVYAPFRCRETSPRDYEVHSRRRHGEGKEYAGSMLQSKRCTSISMLDWSSRARHTAPLPARAPISFLASLQECQHSEGCKMRICAASLHSGVMPRYSRGYIIMHTSPESCSLILLRDVPSDKT